MRLHRLKLVNFRGVAEREVSFVANGVTVVEGPNESGKSSMIEALDLLLDEYDSAKSRRVLAVRPVHDDVGTEIEAEIESGPYRFIYRKTFFKRPATSVQMLAPAPENLTGREAHDHVKTLLAETADMDLWRALRIAQGGPLAAPDLGSKTWLSRALDRAAGGASTTNAGDDTLLAAAEKEYLRYFTATGQERKELSELAARVAALSAERDLLRTRRDEVEKDVERAATMTRDLERLTVTTAQKALAATEAEARLVQVVSLRRDEREAQQALKIAESARAESERAVADRVALAKAAEDATRELSDIDQQIAAAAPAAQALEAQEAELKAELTVARTAADRATAELRLRTRDREHLHTLLEVAQMTARQERVTRATAEAREAEQALGTNRVDDNTLKALQTLRDRLLKAEGVLKAAGGSLRVTARTALTTSSGGETTALAAGEQRDVPVAAGTRIDVPGAVTVEYIAADGSAKPQQEHTQALTAYREALADAGVAGFESALTANAARRESERGVKDRLREVTEALGDLTEEKLRHKVASLTSRAAAWTAERAAESPLPADFDSAQDLERAAQSAERLASAALKAADSPLAALQTRLDEARNAVRRHDGARSIRLQNAERAATKLAAARAVAPDADLATAAADATNRHTAAVSHHAAAAKALEDAGVDRLEQLAANARAVAKDTAAQFEALRTSAHGLRTSLEVRGEMGLAGQYDLAESAHVANERDLLSKRAGAAAAKALFDVLREEQSKVRARYVAPLRDRIVALGKFLYGGTFGVELGEDLGVVARTLEGRTVPFESLSGGAKEQLGLIARLAAAQIVESDGGVPVILDDALGWSDPRRLDEMGALLATAAKASQVIVLTCQPERYRSVGDAARVSFA